MTRINHYDAKLSQGTDVVIDVADPDVDRLIVLAPDPDDADAGHEEGIRMAETVEYHRALTAFLIAHQRFHPKWHRIYKKMNPGGLPPERKAENRQENQ